MVQCEKNWPDGISVCERFSVLALVICCVPGRLWTSMKRRMPWTLWQKTEFITLSQSHLKTPGIRGSFLRFVQSVQVWPNCSWENLGNIVPSFLLEKRGDLFQSNFVYWEVPHLLWGLSVAAVEMLVQPIGQSQDFHLLVWLWACWIQRLLQETHKTLI